MLYEAELASDCATRQPLKGFQVRRSCPTSGIKHHFAGQVVRFGRK